MERKVVKSFSFIEQYAGILTTLFDCFQKPSSAVPTAITDFFKCVTIPWKQGTPKGFLWHLKGAEEAGIKDEIEESIKSYGTVAEYDVLPCLKPHLDTLLVVLACLRCIDIETTDCFTFTPVPSKGSGSEPPCAKFIEQGAIFQLHTEILRGIPFFFFFWFASVCVASVCVCSDLGHAGAGNSDPPTSAVLLYSLLLIS